MGICEMNDWAEQKAREIWPAVVGNQRQSVNHLIGALAQALREAYERGATEMRERAARAVEVIECEWRSPEMKAYADSRRTAAAEIRALPSSPKEPTK